MKIINRLSEALNYYVTQSNTEMTRVYLGEKEYKEFTDLAKQFCTEIGSSDRLTWCGMWVHKVNIDNYIAFGF